MNKILRSFLLVTFLTSCVYSQISNSTSEIRKQILQMTLEEKAKLVVGMGMNFPGAPPANEPAVGQTMDKVPGAAGSTFAIPRLGIPSIVLADGPAGLRISPERKDDSNKYYATAFPISTLLASTWDINLVKDIGAAIGNEVKEYGVDIILMPALNLQRNPLCGRNFEYYSEDPLLSGLITAAMVNGVQSQGVGTSIKHFAANNQETNRNNINTVVSERALRELYLKGFEIAVKESNPWTVMSSYNKINGVYTSESYDLLTKILRDQWDYKGFVMTDWFGGKNPVEQMKAGNDLLMPGFKKQTEQIIDAVNNGELDEKILDKNVENILKVIFQTPAYKNYKFSNTPDLEKNAKLTRDAASEGMVLLKNNDALPLSTTNEIALFGNSSYRLIVGGTGSGDVNEAYSIPLEKGMANAGFSLNKELEKLYSSYLDEQEKKQPKQFNPFFPKPPLPQMPIQQIPFENLSENSNAAIITIGRNSGEFSDRKLEDDFYLNNVELELISKVSESFHSKSKKVIVILNIGGVVETASWKDKVDAILIAWQPGQEGGNSIAEVICGKKNPSGKLAVTFPVKYEDTPSSKNFPGFPVNNPDSVIYEEDIYVGYRYFDSFNVDPSFEFGFGLSYTDFEYSKIEISSEKLEDPIIVSVGIKNTGKQAGREIVQLYISAPVVEMEKPKQELKAFSKTKILQPGESEILTFKISEKDLVSYNSEKSSWIAEKGKYSVNIGSSSKIIKKSLEFSLEKEIITETLESALKPKSEIKVIFKNS